jgi:hypothetical protein
LSDQAKTNSLWKLVLATGSNIDNLEDPDLIPATIRPYATYLRRLQGIGFEVTVKMGIYAQMVGSREAFADLAQAIRLWRARKERSRSVWDPPTQLTQVVSEYTPSGTQELLTIVRQPTHSDVDEEIQRVVALKSQLRMVWHTALQGEAKEIMDMYRQRFLMSTIWEVVEELERLLERDEDAEASAKRPATRARDEVFFSLYGKSRGGAKREAKHFAHMLDKAKRWNILKQGLGVGIFALIPRCFVKSWFESTLPVELVVEWGMMLYKCNKNLDTMCQQVEGVLLTLLDVDDNALPVRLMEEVQDWEAIAEEDLQEYLHIREVYA